MCADMSVHRSVIATLAQLVQIDSVSARTNSEIVSWLEAHCRRLGFKVRRLPYQDEFGIEKINLLAVSGTELTDAPEVELALVGHTDTVPYDSAWTEATRLTERDGKLFGRGACDTKGFIAAALTAVAQVDLNKLRRPLALVFTADEELGLLGAKHLKAKNALHPRHAIVGEPTSLRPIHAGKGYCLAQISVGGSEGHSAYPDLGASAIFRAARLIKRIEEIAHQLRS